MERHRTIFWTPCVAHCLDLMLEDIGKLEWVKSCVDKTKHICKFISIDELEDFIRDSSLPSDGCYLHQVLVSILLFVDDVILLASSPEDLQRILDILASFCDLR